MPEATDVSDYKGAYHSVAAEHVEDEEDANEDV